MARKRIADKEPAISKEGAATAPAKSPAAAMASDSNKARAPRASANAVTHRHKKNVTVESQTPASTAGVESIPAAPAPAPAVPSASPRIQPPSREEIAVRAYLLAESRGFQGGSPDDDWFNAETQLQAERARK